MSLIASVSELVSFLTKAPFCKSDLFVSYFLYHVNALITRLISLISSNRCV